MRCCPLIVFLILALERSPVFAQVVNQIIPLKAGWNAVHIQVDPLTNQVESVFAGIPVEVAWAWNKRFESLQFISNPEELIPGSPDWLYYSPASSPLLASNRLSRLMPNRCYLVKLRPDAGSNHSLSLWGRPTIISKRWLSDSFNLVGFRIDPLAPPTVAQFFAGSVSHKDGPFFLLDNFSGRWIAVQNPTVQRMKNGEAIWAYCKGVSDYQGPLSVRTEIQTGLDFGRSLEEQTLLIRNSSDFPVSVDIRILDSYPENSSLPPAGLGTPRAGHVSLAYWDKFSTSPSLPVWQKLDAPLSIPSIQPKSELSIRLAVLRARFAASQNSLGTASYQGLLQITAPSLGLINLVPVSALGMAGLQAGILRRANSSGEVPALGVGLWLGSVILNSVSQPVSGNPSDLKPTDAPFQFTLIAHVDSTGEARLLQQVILMYQAAKFTTNNGVKTRIAGSYALVTDDNLVSSYTPAEYTDATRRGRRLSSCAFAFRDPLPMIRGTDGSLSCRIVLGHDDPLNPFKHLYHPDHDNLENQTWMPLSARGLLRYAGANGVIECPSTGESYTVVRQVSLSFSAADESGKNRPIWGSELMGGIYEETIYGIHRDPLRVRGTFEIQRALKVPVLNPPLQADGN